MHDIGKFVYKRRTELGMTMDELAKLVGYKERSSIDKIEKGKMRVQPEKYDDFARALKTDVYTLTGMEKKAVLTEDYLLIKKDGALATIVSIYSDLPADSKARLLAYCQGLADAVHDD